MAQGVQDAYIADGFADDCDELIHRCMTGEKLTYPAFVSIWKDMQLSCIFHERSSGAEIAELSEEVIHIAKHYMVANTSNFEESVAGLFLVYALLNLQPFSGFACLRIVQEDLAAIERIEFVARRDRRQDVLYILGSVLIKGPVQYHAALRERGMEYPFRKYLEGNSSVNKLGCRPKGVFYRQSKEMDIIRELKNLSVQYTKAKQDIIGPGVKDPNLSYHDENFAKKLETSFKKLVTGTLDSDDDDEDDDSGENYEKPGCSSGLVKDVDSIRAIKQKAMQSKVNPIKHRVGVAESTKLRSKKTATVRFDIDSISSDEPSCSYATDTTTRKRKRYQRLDGSDESTDDDNDYSNNETNKYDLDDDTQITGNETQDINLANFTKAQGAAQNVQEVDIQNIQIDSLPCVIRSEDDGNTYEIEIIDNLNVNQGASTSKAPEPLVLEEKLKRAEKRDLKKTILKSRFKRMGMLPVANFPPE